MHDVETRSSPTNWGGGLRRAISESLLIGLWGGLDWRDRVDTLSLPAGQRKEKKGAMADNLIQPRTNANARAEVCACIGPVSMHECAWRGSASETRQQHNKKRCLLHWILTNTVWHTLLQSHSWAPTMIMDHFQFTILQRVAMELESHASQLRWPTSHTAVLQPFVMDCTIRCAHSVLLHVVNVGRFYSSCTGKYHTQSRNQSLAWNHAFTAGMTHPTHLSGLDIKGHWYNPDIIKCVDGLHIIPWSQLHQTTAYWIQSS